MSYWSIFLLILAVQTTPAVVNTDTPTVKPAEKPAYSLEDPMGLPGLKADEYVHDFGTVYISRKVNHIFTIENTGDIPVELTDIKADCGCTVVEMTAQILEPGASAQMTVTFIPKFQMGRINKKITVYTDLPGKRNWLEFNIRAEIASVLTIDPVHVYFKNVHFGQASVEEVRIHAKADSDVDITAVELVEGRLDLELIPDPGDDGAAAENSQSPTETRTPKAWTLKITLPADTPAGKFISKIRLVTNSEEQPEVIIQAIGFVRSQVSILPTQCYLGTLKPGEEVIKTFRISKVGEATLEAPTVKSTLPGLTWTVETVEEGVKYNLEIRVAVPAEHKGRMSGDFTILTNDTTRPEFTVPVFGYTPDTTK